MNIRAQHEPLTMSIAGVERDTGLAKDTLRVWERRYGFPQPGRDAFGERAYTLSDVEKLRVIKRLLDQGHRPGRIVALPIEELQRLSQGMSGERVHWVAQTDEGEAEVDLRDFMQMIKEHRAEDLRRAFSQAAITLGLTRFVTEVVAPLNVMVGEAWLRGALEVFEEHLYTESVTTVIRHAIGSVPEQGQHSTPKVLLTTFPQESHAVGLLMAQSIMAIEGCRCVSLGIQTPLRDIVLAAKAHQVDVVALSCSMSMNPNQVVARSEGDGAGAVAQHVARTHGDLGRWQLTRFAPARNPWHGPLDPTRRHRARSAQMARRPCTQSHPALIQVAPVFPEPTLAAHQRKVRNHVALRFDTMQRLGGQAPPA